MTSHLNIAQTIIIEKTHFQLFCGETRIDLVDILYSGAYCTYEFQMVGIVQVLCLLSLIARKQVKVSYDLHTFLQRKNVDGRCEVGMKSNFLEFNETFLN